MDYKHKQLEQDLSALTRAFSELGARLSEVAKEVVSPGVAPSEKLIEQISASRASFETTRTAVHAHAGAMLVSPLPKLSDLGSLGAIESLLKASAVAEENKFLLEAERNKAITTLSRALSIAHKDGADFKPLQECHAKVADVRNAILSVVWPHRHPDCESIVALKHPSHALVSFVENLDTLDDEKWMALEATITENYGKALFVAASRGKLVIVEAPAESQPASKPVAAAPAPVKAPSVAPEPPKPPVVAEKPIEKPAEKKPVAEKPAPAPAPVAVAPPAPAPVPVAVPVQAQAPAPAPVLTTPAVTAPAASATPAAAAPALEKKPVAQPASPQAVTVPLPVAVAEKKETPVEKARPAAPQMVAVPVISAEKREEKKEIVEKQAVPAPVLSQHTAVAPPAPVTPAPAPVPAAATPIAVPATAPVAAVAPVAATPVATVPAAPPRSPQLAHIPTPVAAPLTPPTPPAAPVAQVATNSLAALVTATDPAEKKASTAVAGVETADKQRKEPRLATSSQPTPIKPDSKAADSMIDDAQKSAVGDASQRPQRWGFWRGNR